MTVYLIDLDGTVYRGLKTIEGAAQKIDEIRAAGHKVLFFSNNSTRSRKDLARKLSEMGVKAREDEVCSAAYALVLFLKERKKRVYFIGEESLRKELAQEGVALSEEGEVVAVGLDRAFNYEKLAHALTLTLKGAQIVAANDDATYPTHEGIRPGAGAIVAAIERASGKKALVLGKPYEFIYKVLKQMMGEEEMVVVGDRLDTDIYFAKRFGLKSILVLSGIAKKEDIAKSKIKPDEIIPSLAHLNLSPPTSP